MAVVQVPADAPLEWLIVTSHCAVCPRTPYRLGTPEHLGEGGMGHVYRVRDPRLERDCAMKVASSRVEERGGRLWTDDMHGLLRFLTEVHVHALLEHPGIVPLYDVGVTREGHPFFTMRYVHGTTFEQVIRSVHSGDPSWSLGRALDALIRACEIVAFAHTNGVIHRDLKPSNLMLGSFGEVFVMDWGLASIRAPARKVPADECSCPLPLTPPGSVLGTPVYMPPEQARAEPEVGPTSDVYSLGATLYHLLTGVRPYSEVAPRQVATILEALQFRSPLPVPELAPGTPQSLAAACGKAMARDPGERHPGALALADDLRASREDVGQRRIARFVRSWGRHRRTGPGSTA